MEVLREQMGGLSDLVHSKLAIRLSQLEKDFGEAMVVMNQSMTALEEDFTYIKGPLLEDFKRVKHEYSGL